ncbi:MAG: hypothetical protein HUJ51_02075 [Eggerthellaceae bacterium]|nr:hypothetical protein [Eggerthellaceae bacterium]
MSDIIVDDFVIKACNDGLGIHNRNEGTVNNVIFSNIIIEEKHISAFWW